MKTLSKKELRVKYRISATTLRKWLDELQFPNENRKSRILTPRQLELFYKKYGRV